MFTSIKNTSLSSYLINRTSSLVQTISNHAIFYPTPINFTYAYSFGSLVGLFFAIQLVTGIFLAMHYTCGIENAFSSVVYIMTDVKYGYTLRYMHANGASMIFILIYLHIGRGLYYRSYLFNRRYLWISGIVIFLLMMGTAFIGYVLPWGQMSFWGATVITSLVTAVPLVGEAVAYWVWGGFSVSDATLVRFFSIHYLLPFIITGLIGLHLVLLHEVTSSNPVQVAPAMSKIPFHPYFTMKDAFAFTVALLFFVILNKFYPNLLGHSDNFIPANPLVTPAHIVPEWYFTPFYAILRACPDKLGGVIFMVSAILILAVLPYYHIPQNSLVSPLSVFQQVTFWLFSAIFLILLILGGKPATAPYVLASQIFTALYFFYFLVVIPMIPVIERLVYPQASAIPMQSDRTS
jgi:ubiquinol-cytochrome c reductase cytochrome b/c1 subunit